MGTGIRSRSQPCYLAEWYRSDLGQHVDDAVFARLTRGATLVGADGAVATVLWSLMVPGDDVIFCVFAAASRDVVTAACESAGIPLERITDAVMPTTVR